MWNYDRNPIVAYRLAVAAILLNTPFVELVHASSPGLLTEICQADTFQAKCSDNQVIAMTSARYGRMRIGRCVKQSYGHIGCHSNVISKMDRRCSGKQECEIVVPDADFDRTAPCAEELKTYLEASYECKTVTVPPYKCGERTSPWRIAGKSQVFISNTVAEETHCAGENSPVEIRMLPGQKINITFYDFNTPYQVPSTSQYDSDTFCDEFVIIYEYAVKPRVRLCPGTKRIRYAYTSTNHTVKVFFQKLASANRQRRFLLQFDAIGCGDLQPGPGMYFRRVGANKADVGCHKSSVKWTLDCDRGEWRGLLGNCSTKQGPGVPETPGAQPEKKQGASNLPYGVTIGVILSLALVIGLIFLVVGILCLRRSHNARPIPPSITPQEDMELKNLPHEIKFCPQHFPVLHPDTRDLHGGNMMKDRDEYGLKQHPSNEYSPMQLHTFRRQSFPHHEECREGLLSHDSHVHHTHAPPGNRTVLMHAQEDNLHNMVQCVYSKGPRNITHPGGTLQKQLSSEGPPCDLTASTMPRKDKPIVPKKPIVKGCENTSWSPDKHPTYQDSSLAVKSCNMDNPF